MKQLRVISVSIYNLQFIEVAHVYRLFTKVKSNKVIVISSSGVVARKFQGGPVLNLSPLTVISILAPPPSPPVHQIPWAHGYDQRVDLLTDLKNMVVCQEWNKHNEYIKARFQFSKAYIWKITFHTMSFEAIFV